jgi:hypothetical protein
VTAQLPNMLACHAGRTVGSWWVSGHHLMAVVDAGGSIDVLLSGHDASGACPYLDVVESNWDLHSLTLYTVLPAHTLLIRHCPVLPTCTVSVLASHAGIRAAPQCGGAG